MRESVLHALAPKVRERIWAGTDNPDDRRYLAGIFGAMPQSIAPRLLDEYECRNKRQGRREANLYALKLREEVLPELCPPSGLEFDASDDDIAETAQKAVRIAAERIRASHGEAEERDALDRLAKRFRVALPNSRTHAGTVARMCEAAWWRRALRKRFRRVEQLAIFSGCVHKRAGLYVSDEAYRRSERHARKTARLMEAMEAVNCETGETVGMDEVRAHSLANPANRRAAMMVEIKGLEAYAKTAGFTGYIVHLTCPSRMHARLAESGDANPRYDGRTSPREAGKYLSRMWNTASRKLKRQGIDYFGLRVAEPHHDGTPHWHMLVFIRKGQERDLLNTLRKYALKDSPDEPGAKEHRFRSEAINPNKGSAAGYVVKYISKNLDGAGVGENDEGGGDAKGTAPRAVVWSTVWGIRQFQFFGAGSVTPLRELYRLKQPPAPQDALLQAIWQAVHAKDYGAVIALRRGSSARLTVHYELSDSQRYPGETAKRVRGIVFHGEAGPTTIVTRPDTWIIRERLEARERRCRERAKVPKIAPLGLDSITPRDVDLTGFFQVSDTMQDTVKNAAKQYARQRGKTNVALARKALLPPEAGAKEKPRSGYRYPAGAT